MARAYFRFPAATTPLAEVSDCLAILRSLTSSVYRGVYACHLGNGLQLVRRAGKGGCR